MMNVILVGATGAVGGELLKAAPQFGIDRLCVLVRRELETSGFANEEWYKTHLVVKKVSFDNVEAAVAVGVEALGGKVTHCISSLGTTKAKAKTAEGFKKIDYYLNYEIAKAAVKAGAQHYSIVSTLGANANSNFLYTQTKGQLDEDVQKLGFATVSIFRPPLILTEGRNESRPLEAVLQACSKWTDRGGWWSIHASKIALAIWAVAQTYTLSHSTQDNTPNISDDNTTQTTVTKIYDPKLIKEAARDWEKEVTNTKASETKASETKASETKASETKVSETKVSETKVSETKVSETKTVTETNNTTEKNITEADTKKAEPASDKQTTETVTETATETALEDTATAPAQVAA